MRMHHVFNQAAQRCLNISHHQSPVVMKTDELGRHSQGQMCLHQDGPRRKRMVEISTGVCVCVCANISSLYQVASSLLSYVPEMDEQWGESSTAPLGAVAPPPPPVCPPFPMNISVFSFHTHFPVNVLVM